MPKLHPLAAVLAASVALVAAAPVLAAPATVNLRIEGATKTHFEGPVTTDVKTVRGELCDGTQDPSNTTPAPTMQGALDDASLTGAFTWDGGWDPGYQDFFVTKINDEDTPSDFSQSWALLQNWKYTPGGGCHMQVHEGDELLFAFTDYLKQFLQLTGAPTRAATGESFQVTVNRQDGNGATVPEVGASVADATTDATGHATISFSDAGSHTFKATAPNTIRSNAATVCVYVPGSGDCGTEKAQQTPTQETTANPQPQTAPAVKDTTPPVIKIGSLTPGKTYSSGPRLLAGEATDAGGIAQVFLRLRATDGGNLTAASRCRWFSGKRGVFTHRTVPCSKARFFRLGTNPKFSYLLPSRLGKGKYVLDVKVLDRAYNAGRMDVPFKVK
jgi:hypothetical protein